MVAVMKRLQQPKTALRVPAVSPHHYPSPLKQRRYPDGVLPALGDRVDMLLGTQYQDHVGYIVEERWDSDLDKSVRMPIGTTFFVSRQQGSVITHYAVTCEHVVHPTHAEENWPLFVRVNTAAGSYRDIPCAREAWICSAISDVAVLKISLEPSLKYWAYPGDQIAAQFSKFWNGPTRVWGDHTVCIGDEVFMTGMFSTRPGENSVQALVRSGRIALPNTVVPVTVNLATKETKEIKAHLIEAMSWGGESGSPVFNYEESHVISERQVANTLSRGGDSMHVEVDVDPLLIGMLHGHFPVDYEGGQVNSGIAIVIHGAAIRELLDHPVLAEDRQRSASLLESKSIKAKPLSKAGRSYRQSTTADRSTQPPSPE